MTFDKWMKTQNSAYKKTDDSVSLRALRSAWLAATKAEREACAKVCHEIQMTRFAHDSGNEYQDGKAEGAKECWQAIRMRPNV